MPHVPSNARWFLADLVMENRVDEDPRNVVHVNTMLVEAGSAEEAWEKALELGRDQEHTYLNTDKKQVNVRFRGLGDLYVVYGKLEHGSELIYQEKVDVPEEKLATMVPAKHELSVFVPPPDVEDLAHPAFRAGQPNLMPQLVVDLLEASPGDRTEPLPEGEDPRGGFGPLAPNPEALRFARHAALLAGVELRRRGLTEQARGTDFLAESLGELIPTDS